MVERVFLGWEQPFLKRLVEWLWARRMELPGMLVVVPTAQSGRRLREALAEQGGGLAPRVVTPGHFLQTPEAASEVVEMLAWVEVFESIHDWSDFEAAFPVPPGEGEAPGWALGLAKVMMSLRSSLQENGLTVAGAARKLGETVEAERWAALALLEERVEGLLHSWGLASRSALLARGKMDWAAGCQQVVLAGVADFPALTARLLKRETLPATALIGAPESEQNFFDELGRPLAGSIKASSTGEREVSLDWNERFIQWPSHGEVSLTADPRQQADAAVRFAALEKTPSNRLVLGTADEETAGELVRAFSRAGWVLHDPSHLPPGPLAAWLSVWRAFVRQPDVATAIDLLGFTQTEVLVNGGRARRAEALSHARDSWLAKDAQSLERSLVQVVRESERAALRLSVETMNLLEDARTRFLNAGFQVGMEQLLMAVGTSEEVVAFQEWFDGTSNLVDRVGRDSGFWLDLLIASQPEEIAIPPEDRVLDVQGWLELFHEPGEHLIICGMNEGKVPARAGTDAWLPESARAILGLSTDATRAARDAFLLIAMIECRRESGRVDLLLAKNSAGGDSLLPSRLLLAASEEELPARVTALFREIEPPDASLAWTLDEAWKWRPREVPVPQRLGVTAFADYLSCPFRFYLKQVVKMSAPEPERVEWNARDFGNIAHTVLENWARDEEARDFSKTEAIEKWVSHDLDQVVKARFGDHPPLAVRIQTESMRQRLAWFARVQACERAAGWRIHAVEEKFEIPLDDFIIVGRIDRIERNEDGRIRVLDYKTGNVGAVESAHRVAITKNTRLAPHVQNVPEVLSTGADGKLKRWKNLQLALYGAAKPEADEIGYFSLGMTEGDVCLSIWDEFGADDREAAMECAVWVIGQVKDRVFWPPAEKVEWDDYRVLTLGRMLEETVANLGGVS